MINKFFKSIIDQDRAPVVVCDTEDIIVYMNPSAVEHYHKDLTGASIKDCHPSSANEKIDKVVGSVRAGITILCIPTTVKGRIRMFIWWHFVMMRAH